MFKIRWIFIGALSFVLMGCLPSGDVSETGTEASFNPIDPGSMVCDPFDTEEQGGIENGVKAELYYLDSSQPQYSQVSDYFEFGHQVEDLDIYFNQIYVPTRPFDRGFVTVNGETILNNEGNTLYEWFALRFSGYLQLSEMDAAGPYQIAILSDDGAILKIDENGDGIWETAVNNDNTHPTRMACGDYPVYMDHNSKIAFEMDYFQGPRYHISAIVLWRPWPADPNDPECGRQGNSRYFDFSQDPPVPTTTYNNMLARGWQVLKPLNYALPDDGSSNECNAPAPTIMNVQLASVSADSAQIIWDTDVPSSSQVIYTNLATGEVFQSVVDETLVVNHMVQLTGLSRNTLYEMQVVSVSASGLSTTSEPPVVFRTSR